MTDIWLILALAGVTYMTRSGGYLVISRFKRLHPRAEAALQAVPAAVMTTLVVPAAINAGPAEMAGVVAAGIASLRLPPLPVVLIGLGVLVAARNMGI